MISTILVQWPSQDFNGDLDFDYIWVFISFYVSRGIEGLKKPNLPFSSVGQFFYDALKARRQSRHQKIFKRCKKFPNIALFSLILKQIACRFRIPCSKVITQIINFIQFLVNY